MTNNENLYDCPSYEMDKRLDTDAELIERVARIAGWQRYRRAYRWFDSDQYEFETVDENVLTSDGLLILQDALLRAGWYITMDNGKYVVDAHSDAVRGRMECYHADTLARAMLLAFVSLHESKK